MEAAADALAKKIELNKKQGAPEIGSPLLFACLPVGLGQFFFMFLKHAVDVVTPLNAGGSFGHQDPEAG